MKCDRNCLNCERSTCIHDLEDVEEYIRDAQKKRAREYRTKYNNEHRQEINARQKEYDRKHRTTETSHAFYIKHKDEINRKNRERYANNREQRLAQAKAHYYAHREEISARRKERRLAKKNAM